MVDYEAFIEREYKLAVQCIDTVCTFKGKNLMASAKKKQQKEWQFFL